MPNTNQRTKDFHDSSLLFKPNSQNPSRMDFSFNKRKEQTHKNINNLNTVQLVGDEEIGSRRLRLIGRG